jgi:hypothetical protein
MGRKAPKQELSHHTKDKGDQGLGFVMASLLANNIQVALPVSEHLPFDLIAISRDGALKKVSVKFRALERGKGRIQFALVSSWSNGSGCQKRKISKGVVDGYAIYCPDTEKCYFVREDQFDGSTLTLRVHRPEGMRKSAVLLAENHEDPHLLFGE